MKGNDIVAILKSPAVSALVITLCVAYLMNQVPKMVKEIRSFKQEKPGTEVKSD